MATDGESLFGKDSFLSREGFVALHRLKRYANTETYVEEPMTRHVLLFRAKAAEDQARDAFVKHEVFVNSHSSKEKRRKRG